jgi:spore coat protein A
LTTRRTFIRQSTIAATAAIAQRTISHAMRSDLPGTYSALDPNNLTHFVDPLPLPLVARAQGVQGRPGEPDEKVLFYRVAMRAISAKLHRDLPPTPQWSCGGSVPGLMFDTTSDQGILVEWTNKLPGKHFLPIDHSLHGAERANPEVRTVVHLHGGRTPPESDGYPEDWFVPGQTRRYYYPNEQDPTLLWYHDHAMGINRLNIYAGLFGLHVIRSEAERQLNLPRGRYEIPLVLFDRHLHTDGQLVYPVAADPDHPWIPEVLGEVPVVNGKIFPYLDVEPRKYRFRVLNAANGRVFRLSVPTGVEVYQIGADQGLLASPVLVTELVLAPGERADLVIDFSPHRGRHLLLSSDDAFDLMQFRVDKSPVSDSSQVPLKLCPIQRMHYSMAAKTRRLTLDEMTAGSNRSTGMLLNKTPWHMPVTETPLLGTTEIWELVNLTDDVHPIHLHLVRFQILDRHRFDVYLYISTGVLRYTSAITYPDPNEMGWKDTVRVNAGTVTRIIVPFSGYSGRYVWHCHNLEHEDNEMMRPYAVLPIQNATFRPI